MRPSLFSMKLATLAIVLSGTSTLLNSQDAQVLVTETQTVTAITVPSPEDQRQLTAGQRLAALREVNAQLLKKQEATLEKLEKLSKEAEQLRIFAKRS